MSDAATAHALKPSPSAQDSAQVFDFLIGSWRGEAKIKTPTGDWQPYTVQWQGRFILDNHAIADEYRMHTLSGELVVLGCNYRSYNPATRTRTIKRLNALTGTWMDLVMPELGGIHIEGNSITYAFKETTPAHGYTRATYTSHSPTHFTWKGDQSPDAKTWTGFMIVDCHRNQ